MPTAARAIFPRGLQQPESGFRFSADALLLACFSPAPTGTQVLDLGAGCGVVGFGLALRQPGIQLTGVDCNPEMVAAARENAARLGLGQRAVFVEADAALVRDTATPLDPESFPLVVCNPPYRDPETGRNCNDAARQQARFAGKQGLQAFVEAAAYVLCNRGRLCLVYLAERLPALLTLLRDHRLEPKRMRFVHSRADAAAKLVLVEARKNGGAQLTVEAPLVLYTAAGLSPEAMAFCPYLACNAQRRTS